MTNIRIPVDINNSKNILFTLEQDFDNLEIMSLSVGVNDVYAQMTGDFGVVVGRVKTNGGFGVQNAKISIFIPISDDDALRSDILQLYPFKNVTDTLPNGVRYNIFPRIKQNNFSHQPIGIFPDITDLTYYPTYLEIYEKYYKFTASTNFSGDYMIFGVPTGAQIVHMDFDLFDTKSFYLTGNDMVTQLQLTTEISTQLNEELTKALNPNFELDSDGNYVVKLKTDLNSMPNVFSEDKFINVIPFWGDKSVYQIGITRCDFDIDYQYVPSAILFGTFINGSYYNPIGYNKQPANQQTPIKNHLTARDLKVIAYKHLDVNTVERYGIFSSVKSEDSSTDGVFMINLPMYEDYYITNEFGSLVPTKDGRGIPTKGHYLFEFFDDNDGIDGNGRRTPYAQSTPDDLNNYWTNINVGVRVPAFTDGSKSMGGWAANDMSKTLFEYDISRGFPRFYTIETVFRRHSKLDMRLSGTFLTYIPSIDDSELYNFPIPTIQREDNYDDILRGCIFSPRFLIQDTSKNDQDVSITFCDELCWYPNDLTTGETSNYNVKVYDWVYGVGVKRRKGITRGEVFLELYPDLETNPNYPIVKTWFFGDNPLDPENVPIANAYAQLLAQKPEAYNRNISAVHYRFNLAVRDFYTAGIFASSMYFGNNRILFETYIRDITDVLPELISNGVYSSYGLNTNRYKEYYYLFGTEKNRYNALKVVKNIYFE